ncbi:MAG: sigma 54-interacting transcriptional regulator [Thermodesulfobacteriota bacterium]
MAQDRLCIDPDERTRFETFISGVSGRFVKLPDSRIDREIESVLREVAAFFQADRCSLLEFRPDQRLVRGTHVWCAEGVEQLSDDIDLANLFPWSYERLIRQGQPVHFESPAELPPEAEKDRQSWAAAGVRWGSHTPLFSGERVGYVLAIESMREQRGLPQEYGPLLRRLGEILVSALEHGKEVEILRRAHDELERRLQEQTAQLEAATEQVIVSEKAMADRLSFERILAETSARFVNLPTDRIDSEIEGAQRLICEHLGLDISSLWQWSVEPRRYLRLTHYYRPPGGPPLPDRFEAKEFFPWVLKQLEATGHFAVCAEHVPPEASRDQATWRSLGIKSSLIFSLSAGGGPVLGALSFDDMREERTWPEPLVKSLQLVAQTFANALARKHADEELKKSYEEIRQLKDRLQLESAYLQTELKSVGRYGEIVGQSRGIRDVLAKLEQVARTDSAVLITGETGTGKELIARAIHNSSDRKGRPMVALNCASLPPGLVESELFGREKGAYTGAFTKQVGRFEVADGSTLFMDEIAELPRELQAKLLRVLEDGKFERLGSTKTIRVDVRLIAATHHDLAEEVRNGTFREDLYYRINVFPIEVPPLRERKEDVPLLVRAFVYEFSEKMGKRIRSVHKKTMSALQGYPWPGNIRELRNVIEHAVILSTGDVLEVQVPKTKRVGPSRILTRKEMEVQHIVGVLERTGWRVRGPNGAAEKLGMKPTTLYSMMDRLGIPRRSKRYDISH